MGWTGFTISKRQKTADVIVREITQDSKGGTRPSWELLAHTMRGRVFYGVMRVTRYDEVGTDGAPAVRSDVYGIVVVTQRRTIDTEHCELLYKDMDEGMGPHYYDMPARMLDMLDELNPNPSGYAKSWRESCREKIAADRAKRKGLTAHKAGDVVMYAGNVYTLDTPAGPRRGWYVRTANGGHARMPATILAAAVTAKGAAHA